MRNLGRLNIGFFLAEKYMECNCYLMSSNVSISAYMMNFQASMLKLILCSKTQRTYNLCVRSNSSESAEEEVQATAIFFWVSFDAMHMLTKNVHAPVYSHSSRTLRFEKVK